MTTNETNQRIWNDGLRSGAVAGYRRRIHIEPHVGWVTAQLEDDFHAMRVILRHDGVRVTAIEPLVQRAPWNTCPGAEAKLVETFRDLPLGEVSARRDKPFNCTHLHDLAVLAAAHANDAGPTRYDVVTDDPVAGARAMKLYRDGHETWHWSEQDGVLTAPPEIAGRTLFSLRDWIASLPPAEREAARLLQWASIVAHGRMIPIEQQSTATAMPPNCYTFQPARAAVAKRIEKRRDFSDGSRVPLAIFDDMV